MYNLSQTKVDYSFLLKIHIGVVTENLISLTDCHQFSPVILSKFERINELLLPLKSSENLWFSDDFRGNRG